VTEVIADVPAPKTMPAQRIMIAARIKTFFILFASLDKKENVYYKFSMGTFILFTLIVIWVIGTLADF
jgi:hypothetical protein